MGVFTINAEASGFVSDAPIGLYVGYPLEYHHYIQDRGAYYPSNTWTSTAQGSYMTLAGKTDISVISKSELNYSATLNSATIYKPIFNSDGSKTVVKIGTASFTAYSFSGTGSLSSDGSYDFYHSPTGTKNDNHLYSGDAFGGHIATLDFAFNGSEVVDYIEGNYYSGIGYTANFYGNAGDDRIIGSQFANNNISGGTGSDSLQVYHYENQMGGAASVDYIHGDEGNDNITVYTHQNSTEYLYGDAGDDTISGSGGGVYIYSGGAGNDTLTANTSDSRNHTATYSGKKSDYLITKTWERGITIEDLRAGSPDGKDILTQMGNLQFSDGTFTVEEALSLGVTINGSSGADTISPSKTVAGQLKASALNDTIYGNAGNDQIDGGAGADKMYGGAGNDTYYVDSLGDRAIETSEADGVDTVIASVSFTLGEYVENLTLTGTGAIDGTGNALANKIIGNSAANVLHGGAGADVITGNAGADTLYGDAGADTLSGGADNDTLYGGADNDKLDGGTGADVMYGGAGNDIYTVDNIGDKVDESDDATGVDLVNSSVTFSLGVNVENLTLTGTAAIDGTGNDLANKITGNNAANVLHGGAGNDTLSGGGGDDTLYGDAGNDTLIGGTENDTLYGGDGNDKLDGGTGADVMHGGAGNDTYVVDSVGDTVDESDDATGVDSVSSSVSFVLGVNVENLTLTGTAATDGAGNALANKIVGNAAANNLSGGDGNDTLSGGAGKDILTGGAGLDTLTGGADADIFAFGPASSTSADKVTDFSSTSGDQIQFSASDFGLSIGQGLNADGTLSSGYFEVVSGKTTIGTQSRGEFLFNMTSKTLYWDSDGIAGGTQSKAPVAIASFTVPSSVALSDFLHASDFHIV